MTPSKWFSFQQLNFIVYLSEKIKSILKIPNINDSVITYMLEQMIFTSFITENIVIKIYHLVICTIID